MFYGVTTHRATGIRTTNVLSMVEMKLLTTKRQCREMKNAEAEENIVQWCHSVLICPALT